jgi:hypothetical protein
MRGSRGIGRRGIIVWMGTRSSLVRESSGYGGFM